MELHHSLHSVRFSFAPCVGPSLRQLARRGDISLIASLLLFLCVDHWDMPLQFSEMQTTNPNYFGFLNESIIDAFVAYADLAFSLYGDSVQHWITFNEPMSICRIGYESGGNAPGRCSDRTICPAGNSSTEPYLCGHHLLLAHGNAVQLYRTKYQPDQHGMIGLATDGTWAIPYDTTNPDDVAAAARNIEFQLGWWNDVTHFGDYPESMRSSGGDRLPVFTPEQQQMLKGSADFIGLNHYTSRYVQNDPTPPPAPGSWVIDQRTIQTTTNVDGTSIGPMAQSNWLYVHPTGMRAILNWVAQRYSNPVIFLTENGVDVPGENEMPLQQALNDTFRVDYLTGYTSNLRDAVLTDGVNCRGYFVWSL